MFWKEEMSVHSREDGYTRVTFQGNKCFDPDKKRFSLFVTFFFSFPSQVEQRRCSVCLPHKKLKTLRRW